MTQVTSRLAFIGCGNIAGPYAESLKVHPELELVGVFDLDIEKRAAFATQQHCAEYTSLDELIADGPDIVVNLTSAPYHYETTKELIGRGQTVYSEKPLALSVSEAQELVDLAAAADVRLACSPALWLGAAQLGAAALVDEGLAGKIRLITADVNQGRIESWHPAPESFYRVGPVVDAGVYPIAYLTAIFGPIRRVTATSALVMPHRTTGDGQSFTPGAPDAWIIAAEFASGPLLRLTCNFFVDSQTVARTVDFHGDTGSVRLTDWISPGAAIEYAEFGEPFTERAPADTEKTIDWAIGVADLAAAVRDDRPHRTTGEHGLHVVEVLEAIAESATQGSAVDVTTVFERPQLTVTD